ncbi:MAG: multidrug effflux MFS transporter [Geminicoccaceae bacterium]
MAIQESERPIIGILIGATMLGPFAVDMYLPALPAMTIALKATESALQLTVASFLLGFALGPLVFGPLSDAIGRRRVLIACIAIFVAMSVCCAYATSVDELIAYRVIQAFGGGSATTMARTIVHDIYRGDRAAKLLSTLMMALSLGLMIAPLIGGQLLDLFGWRSIFWVLALIGSLSMVTIITFLPETLPPERRQPFLLLAALKGYGEILRSNHSMGFMLAGAFAGGAMFAYLAATPFVFIDYFGLSPTFYGALYALNMVGAIALNWLNMRFVMRFGYQRMLVVASATLLVVGSVLLGVAATGFGGLVGMAAAVFAIVGLAHCMGTNGLTGILELSRERAGAASASFAACRFTVGIAATVAIGLLSDGTPRPLGYVVMICALAAFVAVSVTVRNKLSLWLN